MDSGLEFSNKGFQSVCPTGIPSFDNLIGGGFALTSVNIIDEDQFQIYSSMLAKAYISSAILANQSVIIFSPNITNKKSRFIRELPSVQVSKYDPLEGQISPAKDSMKIAFRYSHLPSRFEKSENKFDFSNCLDCTKIEQSKIEFYDHKDIINVLQKKIENKSESVCRILIDQLGSPLCSFESKSLTKIIHQIKICMRHLMKHVCLISLVSSELDLLERPIRLRLYFDSDSVIKIVSFEDKTNPYSQDYVGLLQLLRLPRLNSFEPYNPTLDTLEYGIKIHQSKKHLTIEKLALPPDLGETMNRFTNSSLPKDSFPCSKTNTKLTDF